MPWFKVDVVDIEGEDAERVKESLESAGVRCIGRTVGLGTDMPTETMDFPLHAVVEAATPEEAEARVRAALPEGELTVEKAVPMSPEGK